MWLLDILSLVIRRSNLPLILLKKVNYINLVNLISKEYMYLSSSISLVLKIVPSGGSLKLEAWTAEFLYPYCLVASEIQVLSLLELKWIST